MKYTEYLSHRITIIKRAAYHLVLLKKQDFLGRHYVYVRRSRNSHNQAIIKVSEKGKKKVMPVCNPHGSNGEKTFIPVIGSSVNDTSVTLALFDAQAVKIHNQLAQMAVDPRICVATSVNPRMVGGRLFLMAQPAHTSISTWKQLRESLFSRYRVEISIADETGEGLFVAFDGVMAKLHNMRAHEAVNLLPGNDVNPEESDAPQFVLDMEGNTYTFQVKVGPYNFTANNHSFTISRILGEGDPEPQPAFVDDGAADDNGDDNNDV
ncbi:unnamed protein product [Brassica napus]|uniref:(rape) hypothetical protein n=1 Tax=Brassica napus TaxID=3708 RepID=A0A816KGH4_BRANA|nr:unnamed protein product [Brassica napus]